jgi:hypothetical protein
MLTVVQPVLTPLLLAADRKLRPDVQRPESGLLALANTAWGTASVALVAILALVYWSALELALLTLPVAALLLVYTALIPRTTAGPRFLPCIPDLEEAILPLSARLVPILAGVLGAQAFAFGFSSIVLGIPAFLLGSVKAVSWYFMIQTVCIPLLRQVGMLTGSRPVTRRGVSRLQ